MSQEKAKATCIKENEKLAELEVNTFDFILKMGI
jgi:hypothetical protein